MRGGRQLIPGVNQTEVFGLYQGSAGETTRSCITGKSICLPDHQGLFII